MEETRKLSTIVFADIAGYTATMQADEQKALNYLNGFKLALEEETQKYDGAIVQFFGDGCLLSFESATKALYCSIELQKRFMEGDEIPVRIGIHIGEVVFKEGNVFGDGVNIASRIESMGIPGAVLVSKAIRDQVKNKLDILLVSLGTFNFKNVTEPMEVFAVANPGFVVPKKNQMQGKLEPLKKSSKGLKMASLVGLLLVIAVLAWQFFSGTSMVGDSAFYHIFLEITDGEEVYDTEVVAKFNFGENTISGQFINADLERGVLNGSYSENSLQLTFITVDSKGECELKGKFNKSKSSFKAAYGCMDETETGTLNAFKIDANEFPVMPAQDSIYLVK